MTSIQSQSKFWCFTINNPTDDDHQNVANFLEGPSSEYGIVGREVAASGTPHLQGYVVLSRSHRLSYLRNNISPRGNYRIARGTPQQNRDYCTKQHDFDEYGTLPEPAPGKRSDLDELVDWIDHFITDNGRAPTSPDFAKHQPKAYIKYPRIVRTAHLRCPPRKLEFGEPNEWQTALKEKLDGPADDRRIIFVTDHDGGKGKTWFCRWMITNAPERVQILGIGKIADVAYMIDETKSVFLFNIARGQMEKLQYSLLENLKDRMIHSGKYVPKFKTWEQNVHVVVLSNEDPDFERLTDDRYELINI